MQQKNVLVAMSGGVDSSVTAYLLLKQGYRCGGATMRLYRNADLGLCSYRTCCSEKDIDDADSVCFGLDIPFEVLDFTTEFGHAVIGKFISVYEQGGTPNPCIDCNHIMKFDLFLKEAGLLGYDNMATGHYARIDYDEGRGRWLLRKALDESKDQSYVLYMLTQQQLAHTLLPLGALHKSEVREIAEREGFVNAFKRDSQDICFVPDGDYVAFMERYTGKTYPPGNFIDRAGRVLGQHRGAVHYTVGQRRGLALAMGEPYYVIDKDMEKNLVIVGPKAQLFSHGLLANEVNWIAFDALTEPRRVMARTRYHQPEQPATVYPDERGFRLVFDTPQRALTIGQAVVLYEGDIVLGGGTICSVLHDSAE